MGADHRGNAAIMALTKDGVAIKQIVRQRP